MKVIEPLSSALLITACVYVAGISQYSSLMRFFGVNPAFSQPAIDKIFYDGGLITFEVFIGHLSIFLLGSLAAVVMVLVGVLWRGGSDRVLREYYSSIVYQWLKKAFFLINNCSGVVVFAYLIFLTFTCYGKAKIDGVQIGETFVKVCHAVELKKDDKKIKGCAFSKDRDAIWFYSTEDEGLRANSKPLSELDQITYFDPYEL